MKVKFLIWAKNATIDSVSNTLSVLSVIEELKAPAFPATIFDTKLIAMIERNVEKESSNEEIEIIIENNGKPLIDSIKALNNFEDKAITRLIASIEALTIKEMGVIKFIIKHRKKEIGSYSIPIKQQVD